MPVAKILSEVAGAMLYSILFNYIFLMIYVIIIVFIKKQYEKYIEFYRETSSYPAKTLRQMIEEIILSGLIAGFIASIAVVFTGVAINLETFYYLLFIMGALLFINLRYVCFAYAGGILSIFSLIFGKPEVNITSILILIAALHLIEAVLILINAGKDNIPIIIKHNNRITGAFMTQHFWPIPIILLAFVDEGQGLAFTQNITAVWWPLSGAGIIKETLPAVGLAGIIAVLNYSEVAITRHPGKISRANAVKFFSFGVIMLVIAIFSSRFFAFKVIGIIFAITAHEAIILYNMYKEKKGTPLYDPVDRGLRVLEVLPYSNAERIGIQRGDIILKINGKDIQTKEGVQEALREYPRFVWIDVKTWDGKHKTYEYKCYPGGINNLGIVSVPRESEVTYNIRYFQNLGIIRNLVARFKGFGKPAE